MNERLPYKHKSLRSVPESTIGGNCSVVDLFCEPRVGALGMGGFPDLLASLPHLLGSFRPGKTPNQGRQC